MNVDDAPKYHLRVAREARLVEPNVLWFSWCGYVYAEPSGTYDLSIFLRNCAIGGALCAASRGEEVAYARSQIAYVESQRDGHRAVLNRIADRLRVVHEDPKIEVAVNVALDERDTYLATVRDLLGSAHPHPTEHPAMAEQWARARALLRGRV